MNAALHHFRRHRRRRQVHAHRAAAERLRERGRRGRDDARTRRHRAGRGRCATLVLHRPMDALTETLLVFAARRDHLRQRHRAGAGARHDRAVRPLHRCHLRLPGRRARLRRGGAAALEALGATGPAARPDAVVRHRAASGRAASRRGARARSLRAPGRGVLRARARRLSRTRRRRAAALRAHRRGAGRKTRCADASSRPLEARGW